MRTTATAPTTTGAGTAASKARPTIRRSRSLRNRQVKNFLTVTMLSLGVPMILMGDEVRRTQRGNNNAYCHDNETNWFDWALLEKHADVHRFVHTADCTTAAARRRARAPAREPDQLIREANKAWHGVKLNQPDWGDASHSVAFGVGAARRRSCSFHLILNAYWEPLDFELPPVGPAETHGGDGSTRHLTPRKTSFRGRQRHQCQAIDIA